MSRASGKGGLNYSATLNIEELKKKSEEALKLFKRLQEESAKVIKVNVSSQAPDTKALTAFQQARVTATKTLLDAQLASEKLRQENLLLDADLKAGRITAQQAAAATKANTEARLAEVRAQKEARKSQVAANGSYDEANRKLRDLGRSIKAAEGGFNSTNPAIRAQVKEYNDLNTKLKEFDATLGNHQRKVGDYKSALSELKGLAATYLSAAAILAGGNRVIAANAEISDSLSDVRRTAGLTAIEAENLSEQLKKLDTRTSLKGLLEISTIGGQLGIAKDQLGGFTAAVDQLAVSLSGELQGGAEGIAKSLGVLDNVFGITNTNAGDVEKSFNQIGSAILGLGQSGLATGDFLTDFGERVGGVAKQAGLSLPVILSYGAVLQENGVSAEVAGTSFKKLLSTMATSREKFFAVAQLADANLTLKDFTNTINTDSKKALDMFFAGLAKGGTTTTSFADILKSLKLSGSGLSQTIAALSGHQESLNGHIQQATKDFNEASLSAEQAALKNETLAGSIEKLDNTITKITTSGRITSMFKGIIDGATNALDKFNNLVNSDSWKEFWTRLSSSNGVGNDIANFTKSFSKVSKNNNDNQQFMFGTGKFDPDKLKNLGAASFNEYLGNVKKTYDTALNSYAEYAAAVQTGRIKEQKFTVDQSKFQFERSKSYYTQLLELQTKFGYGPKAPVVKKTTPAAEIEVGSDKERKNAEAQLNAQRTLQSEIDSLTKKGRNKQLDADAQELADVDAKYEKLFEKAKKFNDSVASYNKDPKNKNKKIGVNTSGLLNAQSTESDVLRDKQATVKLKITLDEQKKLYDEFETYRGKLGVEQANKLASGKIDAEKTYLQYLQSQEDKLIGVDDKGKGSDGGGVRNEQQLKLVQEEIKITKEAKEKADKEMYADAYLAAETFAQKELAIRKKYNEQLDALLKKQNGVITDEQRKNLDEAKGSAINAAKDEALQKTEAYRKLNADILSLSNEQIVAAKTAIEDQLKSVELPEDLKTRLLGMLADLDLKLKISADQRELDVLKAKLKDAFETLGAKDETGISLISDEEKNRLLKIIADLQKAMKDLDANGDGASKWADKVGKNFAYLSGDTQKVAEGISKDAGALGQSFSQLGAEIGASNEGLGDTISTMGELLTVASDAAGSVASFASGDIIGGITKAISAISGVFAIGRKARESEIKAQQELKQYHDEIFQTQLDYNSELRKRIANEITLNDIYKSRVANTKEELEANKKNATLILKDQQETLNRLLKAQTVTGMHTEKYGGFLGIGKKTRTVEDTKSVAEILGIGDKEVKITNELFDRLEKLNSQSPLTGDAKSAYEQLKKLRDEYGSIEEANRQASIALNDAITGTTAQSIGDSIKQGLASGKKSFADFADDIEGFLRQGILAGMSSKFIEPQMQKLQDELANFLGDGVLSVDEKKQFQEMYMKIANEASDYAKIIDQAGIGVEGAAAKQALKSNVITSSLNEECAETFASTYHGKVKGVKFLTPLMPQ